MEYMIKNYDLFEGKDMIIYRTKFGTDKYRNNFYI